MKFTATIAPPLMAALAGMLFMIVEHYYVAPLLARWFE